MDTYGILWLVWVLLFLGIEGQAILNSDPHDTLSEKVWKWIGKRGYPKPTWYKARRVGLLAFLVWLVMHFLGDW